MITTIIADAAQTQLDALDISGLQSAADKLLGAAEFDVKAVLDDMRAGKGIDAESLIKKLIGVFAGLMRARMAFIIAIITCAAISGAAARLCGGGSGARISEMACLCVCAGMIVADFTAYITQARGILELMGGVLDALLPLIAGLMAALGAKVAGGLLGGVAAAVAGAGLKFGREYLIGMALVSAALELCSGLYSRLKLARAAELMRSLSGLMVGAALVLVLGMITINGSLGVQVDEVGVRAAKYALDKTRHMFAMVLNILCFDFLLSLAQHFHKFRFHVILFINRLCHTIAMRDEAELLFEYTLIIIAPINRSLGNYMFEANQ